MIGCGDTSNSIMSYIRVFFIFILIILSHSLLAQTKYTVSGYIEDASSGEDLISANIYVKDSISLGAISNIYGFYSLTLEEGNYTLVSTYLGFAAQEFELDLNEDLRLNINLAPESTLLNEIVVKAEKKDHNVSSTDISRTELSSEEIKSIPAFMGEVDILKAIQLLPGVQSAGEGNSGLYVRGGGPDQNLILLDEAIVYNPGHLFGFFSVFNADAIKNTVLYKGGMPAQYGGRLSSVLDISMKEGNNQRFQATGGIGLISSRLTLEGPIVKRKSSFMVSGRRTYADILSKPFLKGTEFEGNGYYFYDLNAKFNYKFSDKDRLYLSGYFGRDVFNFTGSGGDFKIDIPWGNATFTARWNHLFNNRLFVNTSLIYNNYDFSTNGSQLNWNFSFFSKIKDINGKIDFDYFMDTKSRLRFGLNYIHHNMSPITASFDNSADSVQLETDNVEPKYGHELAAYLAYELEVNARFKLNIGLRASGFQQTGPYTYLQEDEAGEIIDTVQYGKGKPVKTYGGLEPRVSFRWLLNTSTSLKGAFTVNKQYVHLVSNSNTTLPTDIWVPSSKLIKPQNAYQISMGIFKNFSDNRFETSIEIYYKKMENQIEYEDGYTPGLNEEVERNFVFGKGYSYGLELFVKKRYGKLTGWVGYTLSWTNRNFPDINSGMEFPAKYDRRHDISVTGSYDLNDRWRFSATFVFGTGNAFTMPDSWYIVDGAFVQEYVNRNNFRLDSYHRMDIAVTLKGKESKKFSSNWVFAIYNVYNRHNPYFIYFAQEGNIADGSAKLTPKQVSLFPIIPSITWNFKFK